MADNLSIFPDNHDHDDFSDWIELHNTSSISIDLTGYFLTDNYDNPTKWAIPEGCTIPAQGFLVIRADGFDDKPGTQHLRTSYPWDNAFTSIYYHTNFKLAAEGEQLALFFRSGSNVTCIDSVTFPPQLADVSMGRLYPADTSWYRFDEPTPGAPNTSDAKQSTAFSGNVTFSPPGGFYSEARTIELSTARGTAYYTVNGTAPTTESFRYDGPITIDSTTVVRARCIEPDRLAGRVTTNTYFIGQKRRSLPVVAINTDSSFLFNTVSGVWFHSLKYREWPTSFEVFTPDGKQVINVNGGMTLGSLSNFYMPQKPLQFKCRNEYGDDYIWYKLFTKNSARYRRLRLRQGGDSWDANYIADGMLESICRDQMELGYQAYSPAIVFVNGLYYGIEAIREQFDDQFFINNFGVDPTRKDELRTTFIQDTSGNNLSRHYKEAWEVVSGNWTDYRDLLSLVMSPSANTPATYDVIKSRVNVNSCIDFFAAIIYGAQLSWTHNQDLWRVPGGKWQWLVADFDRAFNDRNINFNMFSRSFFQAGGVIPTDTLFTALMAIDEFRNHFSQRFAAHLSSTFHRDRLYGIIDSLHTLLLPEMEDHANRWRSEGGIGSVFEWESELEDMKEFIDERPPYIFNHVAEVTFNPFGTALLTIETAGADSGDFFINGVRMSQTLDTLRFFRNVPIEMTAIPKPGFTFSGWTPGDTAATIRVILSADTVVQGSFLQSKQYSVPAEITSDTTLDKTDHPYTPTGDIIIAHNTTLVIREGVRILMPLNGNIIVHGQLMVLGSEERPVVIRENGTTGADTWGALSFEETTDTSILSWVTISGTTLGSDPLRQRAGINGNGSQVKIDHLTMSNIVYPLYFEYGSTAISHSTIIVDHICNGAIHIGRGDATVDSCRWISTGVTINTDAIDIKGVHNGKIRGNSVYNFNGFNSDAIDIGESSRNIVISGNIIYGSYDKGISIGGRSTATVLDNIIVNCDLGIGIKDNSTSATVDHNTFIRNRIGIAVYAKVFGRGGGSAKVSNSLFYSSHSSSFFTDPFSSVSFSHCLSDGDFLPGTANLFGDPMFIAPRENNFTLSKQSPCINRGDSTFSSDSDGTATDIGARHTFSEQDFPDSLVPAPGAPACIINEIMYNDGSSTKSGDWIELYNPYLTEIDISNWKLTDKGEYTSWETSVDISDVDTSDIFIFPSGTVLKPGAFLVIAQDLPALVRANPSLTNGIGTLPFNLRPDEPILLYNSNDSLINVVFCRKNAPWPTAPDGAGPSLELIDAEDFNYHPRNWIASAKPGGTPGRPNTQSPPSALHRPLTYALAQNFPNPCHTITTLRFDLPEAARVTIELFNLSGRYLKTIRNQPYPAGYHAVTFSMKPYSAGMYLYRIKAGTFVRTRKITLQ